MGNSFCCARPPCFFFSRNFFGVRVRNSCSQRCDRARWRQGETSVLLRSKPISFLPIAPRLQPAAASRRSCDNATSLRRSAEGCNNAHGIHAQGTVCVDNMSPDVSNCTAYVRRFVFLFPLDLKHFLVDLFASPPPRLSSSLPPFAICRRFRRRTLPPGRG